MFCDILVLVELSPFVTWDLCVYSGDSILVEPELPIYTFTTPKRLIIRRSMLRFNHSPAYVKVQPFAGIC
jgi:hypothetical protein